MPIDIVEAIQSPIAVESGIYLSSNKPIIVTMQAKKPNIKPIVHVVSGRRVSVLVVGEHLRQQIRIKDMKKEIIKNVK